MSTMSRAERIVLALAFAAWAAIAVTGAVTHEPWWDEAQAWLIARDVPIPDLFTRVVRYEGHPPLWVLLVKIPVTLGLPYAASMKVLGLLFGSITALLLLYGFPRVPLAMRLLAPFGYFVLYHYTVVARSYVLVGVFLLLLARMYDRRAEHPWRFALLLIALSWTSVHAFALACAFAFVFLIEQRRRVPIAPAVTFVVSALLLVAMLWPPPDNISAVNHGSILSTRSYKLLATNLVPELFWGPPEHRSPTEAVLTALVALVAMTILVFWLLRRGTLAVIALPLLSIILVSARYFAMWHEGIFFFLLLFASFLAFSRPAPTRWLDLAGRTVLVLLLIRNAQWAFQTLAHDVPLDFTGSKRAAEFLRERGLHEKKVYGFGIATLELQPYFEKNLFGNWTRPTAYWEWSAATNPWPYTRLTVESREEQEQFIRRSLAESPEVIVYAIGLRDDAYKKFIESDPHYRRIGSFHGQTYWKSRLAGPIGFDIYQRVP